MLPQQKETSHSEATENLAYSLIVLCFSAQRIFFNKMSKVHNDLVTPVAAVRLLPPVLLNVTA